MKFGRVGQIKPEATHQHQHPVHPPSRHLGHCQFKVRKSDRFCFLQGGATHFHGDRGWLTTTGSGPELSSHISFTRAVITQLVIHFNYFFRFSHYPKMRKKNDEYWEEDRGWKNLAKHVKLKPRKSAYRKLSFPPRSLHAGY